MTKPRVLLADDHTMFIDGLREVLGSEVDVVGTAADGRELLKAAAKLEPEIIVTDISMPVLNGLHAIKELRKTHPRIKVIVLTMHADVKFAEDAFRAGASGYVVKSSAAVELLTAIREVQKGGAYVTPQVAKDVLEFFIERVPATPRAGKLTDRQIEVLQLIAEGYSIKGMADTLNISVKTAGSHRYAIMKELDLHTTAELTRYAIQQGLVSLS